MCLWHPYIHRISEIQDERVWSKREKKKWDEIEWIIVWSGILAACYLRLTTKTTTSNRPPPVTFFPSVFLRYCVYHIDIFSYKKRRRQERTRNASLFHWPANDVLMKNQEKSSMKRWRLFFVTECVYENDQLTLTFHQRWTSCLNCIAYHK